MRQKHIPQKSCDATLAIYAKICYNVFRMDTGRIQSFILLMMYHSMSPVDQPKQAHKPEHLKPEGIDAGTQMQGLKQAFEFRQTPDNIQLITGNLALILERQKLDNLLIEGGPWDEANMRSMRILLQAAHRPRNGVHLSFRYADLSKVDLGLLDMVGTRFVDTNLSGANLNQTDMDGAHLENTNLSGASLNGTYMGAAHLEKANLSEAKLNRTYLGGAHLEDANLRQANLSNTFLMGAYLQGADFTGATLDTTNLT